LENFFEKKFSKPFKKLYLKPRCGFRKAFCFFISRKLNVLALTNSREARVCVRGRARVRSSGAWGLKAPKVLPLPFQAGRARVRSSGAWGLKANVVN
jgi:hypothetical protein